jgi:hypothetical protein
MLELLTKLREWMLNAVFKTSMLVFSICSI